MDDWLHEPGAEVQGHRAVVRSDGSRTEVVCTCGYRSPLPGIGSACLALVRHLEHAVRAGAAVTPGQDGASGVREPSRPVPPHDSSGGVLAL